MFDSALLTLLYGTVSKNPSSNFTVSDGLFNSLNLSQNGELALSGSANALGGMTVDLGAGSMDTATISDNIYGSQSIHFSDASMDTIVGRPSLFGESFTQGGTSIGSIEPSLIGDGFNVVTSTGTFTGSSNIFSSVDYSSSSMNTFNGLGSPSYLSDASSISDFSSFDSAADVLGGLDAVSGLDFLDIL